MLLESALFIGGMVGVLALGAPVVAAASRNHRWGTPSGGDAGSGRERGGHTAVFTPLDLGPDPIKWPSERPWSTDRLPDPEWPSKTWNDEHFGSHWRDGRTVELSDLGFHAMAGRRFDNTVDEKEAVRLNEEASHRRHVEAERRAVQQQQALGQVRQPNAAERAEVRDDIERERQAQRQRAIAQRERQQQASMQEQARHRQQQVAMEQLQKQQAAARQAEVSTPRRPPPRQQPAAPKVQRSAPQPPARQSQAPSREELEALIARVGLAGTVQSIMDRTGWDFRQAAHYLAKIRQGG